MDYHIFKKPTKSGKRIVHRWYYFYEIQPVKMYNNTEIKQIRNSVGMTQVLFADYMGVSSKTVESWDKGTNHPQEQLVG